MAVRARGISGADIEGGGAGRAFKAYGGSEFLQEEEFLVSDSKKQSIQTTAAERTRVPREFSEKVEAVKEIQALVRCVVNPPRPPELALICCCCPSGGSSCCSSTPGTTWLASPSMLPSRRRTSA
mmetsp:Transcript_10721/g.35931  ORF Transcript_10721/g.35931 Transcript_10721/m.35931 type:complete len:125 (+) Transcript_10721:642-1016(+)